MTENYFTEFFKYNKWANDRFRDVFRKLEYDLLNQNSDLGNILERIVHIFASFGMWRERMEGKSPKDVIDYTDFSQWTELEEKWIELDEQMIAFVSNLSSDELENTVTYESLDGKTYSRKITHILTHLTQHPTYHRGQITTVFKQDKFPSLPPTDVVLYYLEKS